jgi:hypothetical protein
LADFGNRHVYQANQVPDDDLELGERAADLLGAENLHANVVRVAWLRRLARDRWRSGL